MKCDNCKEKPVYVVENRGANVQYFCDKHLPLFLRDKSRKPFLTKWSEDYVPSTPLKEEKKAVAKKTAKKKAKAKAVVEEPVVEEIEAVAEDVAVAEEVEAVAVVEEINESDRENSDETGSSGTL